MDRSNKLSVCTLSGTQGIGRNSTIIEFGKKILIVDYGFDFPDEQQYGIDYLIPNYNYLKKRRSQIVGILLTHGHLDHTGGLPYLLPVLGFPPVYAGRFANGLIRERLKEFGLEKKTKLLDVKRNTILQFGNIKVKFIGVTHSIPNSFSIFVETPAGNIFFSGDYKIDKEPENEPETDYKSLKSLRGKVDLALMESTNAEEEGKTVSAQEVGRNLDELIKKAKGRIIVSAFSSLVSRLYSLMEIAKKYNKKVFISGRSIETSIKIATQQGYINIPKGLIQPIQKLKSFQNKQIMILATGSQGERYSALNRMALGEHKEVKLGKGDLVVMSSSEIPGNILQIEKMTDKILRREADLVKGDMEEIYESGHGLKLDMKFMHDLVRPKFVMPVHGSRTKRYINKQSLLEWGMDEKKILMTSDGQTWLRTGDVWKKDKRIESKPILIDGLGVGDVGDIVLSDREQLAHYGMVCVILNLSSKTNKLMGKIRFISRGFVYVKASKSLMNELEGIVRDIHQKWVKDGKKAKINSLKREIEKQLRGFIYKRMERDPMILTVVV